MAGDASTIPESPMIMIDEGVGALGAVVEDVGGTVGCAVVDGAVVDGAVVTGAVVDGAVVDGAVVDEAVVTGVLAAVGALPFAALEQLLPTNARTMAAASSHLEGRDLIFNLGA